MNVLDLFSGIGGFSLGLERAGMKTVAFCEIEEYPCKVLAKHWPDVPIYNDVRELTRERLILDGVRPQRIRTKTSGAWGEQQFSRLVQDTLQSCVPTGRMGGISDGVPRRMDRLTGLGNAVVPQIPELIGRAIIDAQKEARH